LQTRGAIYHHRQLVFHNGFIGKKYLILLNSPTKEEPYLFVKTTSQQKDNLAKAGCIKERSLFFIPAGKTIFKEDTWIQLYDLYDFTANEIDTNKDMTIKGTLNVKMIDDIVNCLFLSEEDNISKIHKRLLRPPLYESLLKLKEKFNRNR
jgi:hypothetical protein